MKKSIIIICLTAISAFIFSSCGNSSLVTETYKNSDDYFYRDGDSVCVHIELDIDYLKINKHPKEFAEKVNSSINSKLFGEDYKIFTVEEACKEYTSALVKEYKEECDAAVKYDLEMAASKKEGDYEECNDEEEWGDKAEYYSNTLDYMNWEYYISGGFGDVSHNMVSYIYTYYAYTGGAHGNSSTSCININAETGESISEDKFFIDGYEEELSKLLRNGLKASFDKEYGENSDEYECLFVKDIEPNGNFMITKEGISYIYNTYEIAAYVMGAIYVPLTWEEIEPLLRKED